MKNITHVHLIILGIAATVILVVELGKFIAFIVLH
jgi:hypothetical protein